MLWFLSESVLMFSSKSFIVSGPTFRSLIYFEFMFLYGVRKCSGFILLHIVDQFSQHQLWKRPKEKHPEEKTSALTIPNFRFWDHEWCVFKNLLNYVYLTFFNEQILFLQYKLKKEKKHCVTNTYSSNTGWLISLIIVRY